MIQEAIYQILMTHWKYHTLNRFIKSMFTQITQFNNQLIYTNKLFRKLPLYATKRLEILHPSLLLTFN